MVKKLLIIVGIVGLLLLLLVFSFITKPKQKLTSLWQFQSIDTMKYSRDLSRQYGHDASFDTTIDMQMTEIAQTNATYVAIATPYDDEFLPILKRWVASARDHHLHVWFRGNWSGWEGWFDYPNITRREHLEKTKAFILQNKDLFADGDVFSACPECENGGPGDPRTTGDVIGHRQFLIDEYQTTHSAFATIDKQVASNYDSMNADAAKLVMDKATTKALGGIVVIDHYVANPTQLATDITIIAHTSGGKVVLGEFGAPIPDITGPLTELEQADWLNQALAALARAPDCIGGNYWVSVGGSTALWDDSGKPKKAVNVLKSYFTQK